MPNYLLAYHGGSTPDGEDAEEAMIVAWNNWLDLTGEAMLDLGSPVNATMTINPDGSVTKAPPSPVSGYSIIEADDMDAAIIIAQGCPVLADGASIEVSQLEDMLDFEDDEDDEDGDED